MTSVAHQDDDRFAEAEAELTRGEYWAFREPDAPNPLTIKTNGWSTGHTKYGKAEYLNGVDRDGKTWSVLVGSVALTKSLIEGLVERWDDEKGGYAVVETLGRVEPDEVVSIKYLGEDENAKGQPYPRFATSRKPAKAPIPEQPADGEKGAQGDDIPF